MEAFLRLRYLMPLRLHKGGIMNPFSAIYYIKRNKARAISIIIMLACTAIVFMGGMYIDNINDVFAYAYEEPAQYALWVGSGNNNDINDEVRDFYQHQEELLPESAKTHIGVDVRYADYKSIMGFNNGITVFFMTSKEDFDTFVRLTDILPEGFTLEDNEVVMSEMLANNWGVKEGDILSSTDDSTAHVALNSDMLVKKVLPLKGNQIYGWSSSFGIYSSLILSTTEEHAPTLAADLNALRTTIPEKYPHIQVYTNEAFIETAKEQTSMLSLFFMIVIVIVAVVFAITLNATFAAMYEKRKYEFSIYKAIGFSKFKLFKKVLSELVVMDGIGLLAGGTLCFVAVKVLNELLWSKGIQFIRPSVLGIVGTLACNVAIIIPVVMANMKRIKKYDVTVY